MNTKQFTVFAGMLLAGFGLFPASASAAVIYSQSAYQSPVRAEPEDLLMLPGAGFAATDKVVYQALANSQSTLTPPSTVPTKSTATLGTAPIVSTANLPNSLTVKLPAVMQSGQTYALWVRNAAGQWSNGIKINDARPLWISPAYVYQTAAVGSLPRYLKVVGRNLQPVSGRATQIQLVKAGATTPAFTLTAANDNNPQTAIEHYAAKADLPANLPAGTYNIQVTRDGTSWVPLSGQQLTVRADPKTPQQFPVASFGCKPNDGKDDAACVKSAIQSASQASGGVVVFGAGTWNLISNAGNPYGTGFLVPVGVSLRGAGASSTTVARAASWSQGSAGPLPTFTLQGGNVVEDITFKDEKVYSTGVGDQNSMLQLGRIWYTVGAGDPRLIQDIAIVDNVFDKPANAITNGGLPTRNIVIASNEFGAYYFGVNIDGNPFYVSDKFHFDDSVIVNNTFRPGSYMDVSIRQGTIASSLGAGRRVDFSGNTADGASTKFLNNPATDPKGWRASYFWHLRNNQEMLLVAENTATCTGDKTGDGEFIAYDNNQNTFGLTKAQAVITATANTLKLAGPLLPPKAGSPVPDGYYNEHWIQIADGSGVGQVRRIVSYNSNASGVTFTVAPQWDVVPTSASRATVGRQFWQVNTVDNVVDHRKPPCQKSNRKLAASNTENSGVIALWAQVADSAVEGNRQYDTGGILLIASYSAVDPKCPTCTSWSFFHNFVEIRGNTIDHEYNWNSNCSWSGIQVFYGASPTPGSLPPVNAYGVSVARNTVIQADGLNGGAINIVPSWSEGPSPNTWKIVGNTLAYGNTVTDVAGAVPKAECGAAQAARTAIHLDKGASGTVLSANTCVNVARRRDDAGAATVKTACPPGVTNSCECGL